MAQYDLQKEQILTGQEIYEMAKTARNWEYLQSKFKIDLEVYTNILMECEKAGKIHWTDSELLEVLFALRNAQDAVNYRAIVDGVIKAQHRQGN